MEILNQANTLFKAGNYEEARKKYIEFIKQNPDLEEIFQINIELCDRRIQKISNVIIKNKIERVLKPKVSIIVPIYNVEEYIEQCVNSILQQTLDEIEVILVNDGSTDKSLEKIKKIAENDARVVIINNSHASGNSGMPRNQALMKATGEYIAFVDSDDWIEKSMLEVLYNEAVIKSADIVASGGFYREKENDIEEVKVANGQFLPEKNTRAELFLGGQFPIVWYRIYKKDLIVNNGIRFGETKTSADLPFAFKALFKANKVVQVEGSYYHYRFNRVGSTIERRKGEDAFELLKSYENIENFLRKNNAYAEYIPYVVFKAIGDYTYNLRLLDEKYHNAFSIAIAKLVALHKSETSKTQIFNKYWLSVLEKLEQYEKLEDDVLNSILSKQVNNPKMTIIMPAHNVEKYISKSVDSILNQKLKELEIIIINDGSTDNTQSKINNFLEKDNRIKSIELNLASGNAGTPRNIGLAVATGEYIGFVDSDDYITPSMFETLFNEAKIKNADIVSQSSFIRVESGNERKIKIEYKEFNNEKERLNVYKSNYFSNIWNRIYKNNLIKSNSIYFPNIYLSEDMCFSFVTHAFCNKAIKVGGCYYYYNYNRNDSTTKLRTMEKGVEILKSFEQIKEYFESFKLYDQLEDEILEKKLNSISYTYDRLEEKYKADFIVKAKQVYDDKMRILVKNKKLDNNFTSLM
ncbi:glycosyltransferase family 2 protein [Acinetobacter soli]|uniref:glycosyltransferase family 2 protein n=1 Tax=Acinetobacter soli TaxID=487316 RepID=UPI00125F9B36|nr:glycosyltransferase family 2 protein [Acinetobacter soli]MCB8769259.1 glycosyltransferase [Acinetobacter soli]